VGDQDGRAVEEDQNRLQAMEEDRGVCQEVEEDREEVEGLRTQHFGLMLKLIKQQR
jgi:hypothetical protein